MTALYFNHNTIIKKYNQIDKNIKSEALDYCSGIKALYKDNKHITSILNKIALDIQKLTNKGTLSDQDLFKFIQLLKDNDFGYLDCYQIINALLVLSKHENTIFGRKFNFFGVNKTNHIYAFLHNKISESHLLNIDLNKFTTSSIQGLLKINIGIVYLNPNAIKEGQKDIKLAQILLTTNSYRKHPLEQVYQNIINESSKVITTIEQNHPEVYNIEKFTNYLYELLSKPIPVMETIEQAKKDKPQLHKQQKHLNKPHFIQNKLSVKADLKYIKGKYLSSIDSHNEIEDYFQPNIFKTRKINHTGESSIHQHYSDDYDLKLQDDQIDEQHLKLAIQLSLKDLHKFENDDLEVAIEESLKYF